jgi:hypothetical protein
MLLRHQRDLLRQRFADLRKTYGKEEVVRESQPLDICLLYELDTEFQLSYIFGNCLETWLARARETRCHWLDSALGCIVTCRRACLGYLPFQTCATALSNITSRASNAAVKAFDM